MFDANLHVSLLRELVLPSLKCGVLYQSLSLAEESSMCTSKQPVRCWQITFKGTEGE